VPWEYQRDSDSRGYDTVHVAGGSPHAVPDFSRSYGETVRVTDDSEHFNGPLACALPTACQLAVAPGSTFATAATPSATTLPEESLNLTWIA
jgi:hypothetical protein